MPGRSRRWPKAASTSCSSRRSSTRLVRKPPSRPREVAPDLPLWISVTIVDQSGRIRTTLPGCCPVRRSGPGQRRRRMLRDRAGALRAGRQRRRRTAAAPGAGPPSALEVQRSRAVRDRTRHRLRDDRRAHQRHGIGPFPAPGGRRRPRGGGRRRAGAGTRRREPARREHGRRPAGRGTGDDDIPGPRRDRARGGPDPDHDRQLALERARGGAAVPAGQGRGQLDQPQGGRGTVPGPRPPHP